jgi:hypothetical protein
MLNERFKIFFKEVTNMARDVRSKHTSKFHARKPMFGDNKTFILTGDKVAGLRAHVGSDPLASI